MLSTLPLSYTLPLARHTRGGRSTECPHSGAAAGLHFLPDLDRSLGARGHAGRTLMGTGPWQSGVMSPVPCWRTATLVLGDALGTLGLATAGPHMCPEL